MASNDDSRQSADTGTGMPFFPRRSIHLDFHIGPDIPDVGKDFDPGAFAQTMHDAHVDSVTLFAKCHHGHLYYATDRAERHPGLAPDLDLLAEQVRSLHAVGIRAPIYLSVQCDELAATTHPDWVAVDEHGCPVKRGGSGPFDAGWQILDMSSPYQDYLADQVREVIDRFAPLDGLFLDMCWDQPSCSRWAIEGATRLGLDPTDPVQRATYANTVAHAYMDRFQRLAAPALNPDVASGVWFNSRAKTQLAAEDRYLRHIEIEALPTGGWGHTYLPFAARLARQAGKPALSHTGRFHRGWGDHGASKSTTALMHECTTILSEGLTVGVGDFLQPRGVLDADVYRKIGTVYRHVAECEQHLEAATPVAEVAVLITPRTGRPDIPTSAALRVLQQLRFQFDVVYPGGDLAPYRAVLAPDGLRFDEALRQSVQDHLTGGGRVFAAGDTARALADAGVELGFTTHGESPYSHSYVQGRSKSITLERIVAYSRGFRAQPTPTSDVLADVFEPQFERSWDHFSGHDYTPARSQPSEWAGLIRHGSAITCTVPLFTDLGEHALPAHRDLLRECMKLLVPDPILRVDGPTHLKANVMTTSAGMVVHLLSFLPTRAAHDLDLVEDAFPLVDVPVAVRTERACRVAQSPGNVALESHFDGSYTHLRVSSTTGHTMLVLHY